MTDPSFTFAIITDTHIRAPEGDLSSPYPVNEKANGRARFAVEVIRANQLDLTIHLGDMVHPLPHLPSYKSACDEARRIFRPLEPGLHFVPGNHDIGDKPASASPAGPVTNDNIKAYETAFGRSCASFVYQGCQFITINSSLINTNSDHEIEQKNWLEETLCNRKSERVFLFSHYPPFITDPDEPEHYDNYAEPGRSWLLDLAADHDVEAIFSGHAHQFFYNRYRNLKLYVLPPTSFTRQDYAELYRGEPAAEFGRDDKGKFGITLIDVQADGHSLRFAPTEGQTLEWDEKPPVIKPVKQPTTPITPHLRHAWFQAFPLPYNGPMEEFSRKVARNDYPLLRLWQLGLQTIRTPLQDLIHQTARRRILDVAASGVRFSFFCLDIPNTEATAALEEHREIVDSIEIIADDLELNDLCNRIIRCSKALKRPIILGKATTSAEEQRADGAFAHNVSYGFLWKDHETVIEKTAEAAATIGDFSICFQLGLRDQLTDQIPEMAGHLASHGLGLTINLRLSNPDPATLEADDLLIADQLTAVLKIAKRLPNLRMQCDTFEDIDRGYCPRHGLIDRLSNFRPFSQKIINL